MSEILFCDLANNIKKFFFIEKNNGETINQRWHPHIPFQLLGKTKDRYFMFYKKVGRTEFRFDLNEEMFNRNKLIPYE